MIREAKFAGKFYPNNKKELDIFFDSCLNTNTNNKSNIKGLLVPHAGYLYSAKNAALAYSQLKITNFKTAIIIGTAHTLALKKCAIVKEGYFSTVYGKVEIDKKLAEKLARTDFFEDNTMAHENEHSIEVQLPFLQYLKKEFKILPIVLNTENMDFINESAKFLSENIDDDTIIIISSDLSHYPKAEIARISDNTILKSYQIALSNNDPYFFKLSKDILEDKFRYYMDTAACGFSAMALGGFSLCYRGYSKFEVSGYTNSSEISMDEENVVGYGSGVFIKGKGEGKINLSEQEKGELLKIARKSIENKLANKNFDYQSENINFHLPAAIFVTLTIDNKLRGCIGTMSPHSSLIDAVKEYSLLSAFGDYRFKKLTKDELSKIKIEISILSPLKKIHSIEEIKENEHGVYVKQGNNSGVYLPQVWEHFESKEDFLDSLCFEKANLPIKAWKEKSTEIFIFSVDKFKEFSN